MDLDSGVALRGRGFGGRRRSSSSDGSGGSDNSRRASSSCGPDLMKEYARALASHQAFGSHRYIPAHLVSVSSNTLIRLELGAIVQALISAIIKKDVISSSVLTRDT